MSRIKYLDFAKYVNSCKSSLISLSEDKNIPSSENQSLGKIIEGLKNLPSSSMEYDYRPDSYFQNLIDHYKEDPELIENGGEYQVCMYNVILDMYNTSVISLYNNSYSATGYNVKVVCSDGTIYTNPTDKKFTHTWTTDATDTLEDGRGVRWIKVYMRFYNPMNSSDYYNMSYALQRCYPEGYTKHSLTPSPLVFVLNNTFNCAYYQHDFSTDTINEKPHIYMLNNLEYIYLGEKCSKIGGAGSGNRKYHISYCLRLRCFKAEKPIEFTQSMGNIFTYCRSLEYIDMIFTSESFHSFYQTDQEPQLIKEYCFSIRYINPNIFKTCRFYIPYTPTLAKPNLLVLSNSATSGYNGVVYSGHIARCQTLSWEIPDLKYLSSVIYAATNIYSKNCFENVSIPVDFAYSLDLSNCSLITYDSWKNIVNNLKDLTDSDAKVLTIPYINSCSEELLTIARNKNWTISVGTLYQAM